MKVAGIIPVRYNSTRLPGKPLAGILGKPMVLWVYEQAKKAKKLEDVFVTTDDNRIKEVVEKAGIRVITSSPCCNSGTERLSEIVKTLEYDVFVNIQGDEPLISPEVIDLVVQPFTENSDVSISTAVTSISDKNEIKDPNIVKVVIDKFDFALYFSRATIPFVRDEDKMAPRPQYYKHLGIYAYKKDFLINFDLMSPSNLEQIEQLEQLRFLDNGYKIKVMISDYNSISVDTPQDLEKVREIVRQQTKGNK
ncbi:3-deoxy-manno-octulosonate cytidylyltransferase [bacterium]|nr:3-deoxy-manno-octulosonate cytidylyltransferase [bacterium]